jgi:hypothetical protein
MDEDEEPTPAFLQLAAMAFATTLAISTMIPGVYIAYRHNMPINFWIYCLTALSSFLYHLCKSTWIVKIYIIMPGWHKLEVIGMTASIILLVIHLMDNLDAQ